MKELKAEMSELVDKNASSEPPEVLHHYTTAAGLMGILETGTLHFTHALFLNDQSELVYGRDLLLEVLSARVLGEPNRRRRFVLANLFELIKHFRGPEGLDDYHCYVACFCERGNSLSQWRAYGAPGEGYSVAFDTHSFGDKYPSLQLRRVLYNREDQERLINKVVSGCLFSMERRVMSAPTPQARKEVLGAYVFAVAVSVLTLLPQLKHPVFEEEREWRLIALWLDDSPPEVRFRQTGSNIVPFQVIDLTIPGDHDHRVLPITQITHAPCAEPDLRKRSVRLLLTSQGYGRWPNVEIDGSDIPLRPTS